jgi:excisionase family DNA binding protein
VKPIITSQPLALTVSEAAAMARVSVRTIYRAIEAGNLPTVTLTPGGRQFIPRLALERQLSGLPPLPPDQ